MARARLLKPGFFANEQLAALPMAARLLFAGLWTLADREGRLKDIPKWIDGQIFPYDKVNTERLLGQLAGAGFIERYTADDGQRLIWIPTWLRHQHPHINEPPSTLPRASTDNVPSESVRSTDNVPSEHHQSTEPSPPIVVQAPAVTYPLSYPKSKSITESYSPVRLSNGASAAEHPLNFNPSQWQVLTDAHPGVNLFASWREWVLWIEEEGEARRVPRNKYAAFEGWLKRKAKAEGMHADTQSAG